MREALLRTYEAAPAPKWVVAAGACTGDGGIFAGGYACVGGVSAAIPVDVHIPGCPPTPIALLKGLLALMMDGRGSCHACEAPANGMNLPVTSPILNGFYISYLRFNNVLPKF